jgi:hypothetical protein
MHEMCDSPVLTYITVLGTVLTIVHETIAWFTRRPGDRPKSLTQWLIAFFSALCFRLFGRGFVFHGEAEIRDLIKLNYLKRVDSKSSSLSYLRVKQHVNSQTTGYGQGL